MTNVVLLLSHSIEEHDQLKLLHGIGLNVFSIGGYVNPAAPHDDKRPALPQIPHYPELQAAIDALGQPDNLKAAQERIPDAILDWADVIVQHHLLDRLWGQWDRIEKWLAGGSHRRVIWRTVGQSVDGNEWAAQPFRNRGLQIIRYSPKERNIPNYAGEDALIRFYKDPAEWYGWTGEDAVVGNVTQNMADRHAFCNLDFYLQATAGLPAKPAGPGSERLPGGIGALSYPEMQEYLRSVRCYLYTGTQPASYTLGLIEAMMTGVPVVSIGPSWMRLFPYGPSMFEGHEIVGTHAAFDDAAHTIPNPPAKQIELTRVLLRDMLQFETSAQAISRFTRERAIELFGKDSIAAQWAQFLDVPVAVAA